MRQFGQAGRAYLLHVQVGANIYLLKLGKRVRSRKERTSDRGVTIRQPTASCLLGYLVVTGERQLTNRFRLWYRQMDG